MSQEWMWHSCLAFVLAVEQNLEVLLKIAVLAAVFCGLERIHGGPIVLSRTSIRMAALRQKLPLAASKSNFRFTPRKQTEHGNRGMSVTCQLRKSYLFAE
jgi:hypothetical protein